MEFKFYFAAWRAHFACQQFSVQHFGHVQVLCEAITFFVLCSFAQLSLDQEKAPRWPDSKLWSEAVKSNGPQEVPRLLYAHLFRTRTEDGKRTKSFNFSKVKL